MVTLELFRTEGLADEINRKASVTAPSVYKFPANFEIIIELEVEEETTLSSKAILKMREQRKKSMKLVFIQKA